MKLLRRVTAAAAAVVLCACASNRMTAEQESSAADVNVRLGVGYMQRGELELAMEKLKKALQLDPGSSDAHTALGALYEELGNKEKAGYEYRKAVDVKPTDPLARNNYGQFLCKQGRTAEAEENFKEAVKQPFYKTPEVALTNAGACVSEPAEAEEYYREALQRNPHYPDALYRMASLSFQQGKFLQARAFMQRFHDVVRPSAESLWLAIEIERQLGDRRAAADHAKRLREGFPDSPEARKLGNS